MCETTPPINTVIVDDATEDRDTLCELVNHFMVSLSCAALPEESSVEMPEVDLLRNERQQLFTRTVNRGIRHAVRNWKSDVVIVLNTDIVLKQGWYKHLLRMFECPDVGMTGYRDDREPRKSAYSEVRLPNYITGHCFALRVSMLREIGVLCETDTDGRGDPNLAAYHGQAHIGSERILSNRANINGWKTLYCNGLYVQHADGKSWGRDLGWLNRFVLEPLWKPNDTLELEEWL